jgi:hypothetical protein
VARQLVEADGKPPGRRRTVNNTAPLRATRAIAAPAPTAASLQSNPSPEALGESETTVGSACEPSRRSTTVGSLVGGGLGL